MTTSKGRVTQRGSVLFCIAFFAPMLVALLVHEDVPCEQMRGLSVQRVVHCWFPGVNGDGLSHAATYPMLWHPPLEADEGDDARSGLLIHRLNEMAKSHSTVRFWEYAAIAQAILVSLILLYETRKLPAPRVIKRHVQDGDSSGSEGFAWNFLCAVMIVAVGLLSFYFLSNESHFIYQLLLLATVSLFALCDLWCRCSARKACRDCNLEINEIRKRSVGRHAREALEPELKKYRQRRQEALTTERYFTLLLRCVDLPTFVALLAVCFYVGFPLPDYHAGFFSGAIALQLILANMLILLLRRPAQEHRGPKPGLA